MHIGPFNFKFGGHHKHPHHHHRKSSGCQHSGQASAPIDPQISSMQQQLLQLMQSQSSMSLLLNQTQQLNQNSNPLYFGY